MKWLNKPEVEAYLRSHGIASPKKVAEILDAFDFDKPIYEQSLEEGAELFQFIRLPSAGDASPMLGNWFSIPGVTTDAVAIIDGGAGRRLHKFHVLKPFSAIEGVAARQKRNWGWSGGGRGGGTQIYVPPAFIGCLAAVSPADKW
jgi:hypothetical protein